MKKCARENCPGNTIRRDLLKEKAHHTIARYSCKLCLLNFSDATGQLLTASIKGILTATSTPTLLSGHPEALCRLLGCTRKTVARKLAWLAEQARLSQARFLETLSPCDSLQFDELETFEHSKCKPLSYPLW